jgi:hypothetical protein
MLTIEELWKSHSYLRNIVLVLSNLGWEMTELAIEELIELRSFNCNPGACMIRLSLKNEHACHRETIRAPTLSQ